MLISGIPSDICTNIMYSANLEANSSTSILAELDLIKCLEYLRLPMGCYCSTLGDLELKIV